MLNLPFLLCASALALLTAAGLALPHPGPGSFGIGYGTALDVFVAITLVQGAVYGLAVFFLLRGRAAISLAQVLGVAALLRLMVLILPPFISNDLYRYIWDGWVQAHAINPYAYIPADPHLAFLRDRIVYPNINRANYAHTIYPPAAEMLFFLITRASAWLGLPPVFGMKLGMVCFEAGAMAAMLRLLDRAGLPRRRILIYAWNPLPIWEFAGNGHVDALTVCFAAIALVAAAEGRSAASAIAAAVAVLTKFLPLVLLPALWRRWDWRFPVIFGAVILLLYAPYAGAGLGVFGFLGGYTAQEHIASGRGVFLPDLAGLNGMATRIYFAALAVLLLAVGIAMQRRPAADARGLARRANLLIGLLMLGLSPHYPWYFAWILIGACVAFSPACIYLATASFLLYLNPSHTKLLFPCLVFGPFALLGLMEISRSFATNAKGAEA